jgi:membrane-bound metal-dependent hydrolase YbcI (DUF457 family)
VDVFSHFLIPFAGALVFLGLWRRPPTGGIQMMKWRHKLALAIVFGVGGVAPDLDGLYGWLRHTDGFYWLQHRGFSHSLIGAPLHGMIGAGLVALAARLYPQRLSWLRWRRSYLLVGALGGLTHLVLDGITYGGIPLFYPLSNERYTIPIYSWLLIWVAPLAAGTILLFLTGKASPRRVIQITAIILVFMIINAGVRLENRPIIQEDEQAFPRSSYREWIVLTPDPDGEGWFTQLHVDGHPQEPQWHNQSHIAPGSERAVETAKATNAYKGLHLNVFGPIITETTIHEEGGWTINFTAIVPRFDALNDPPWTPTHPEVHEWGLLIMHVEADQVEVIRHGW